VLDALAHRVLHVGSAGTGYTVKLLANTLWFGQAVAIAEALALAVRSGLDPETVRAALGESGAASRFLSATRRACCAATICPRTRWPAAGTSSPPCSPSARSSRSRSS
jgi:3-hydroxyisobutyrate dehydrogenase-like beta-hydroxyacid dehydrogenase